MDCGPPGSSVPGILQARILEWVAIFLLQWIFLIQGSKLSLLRLLHWWWILHHWATSEAQINYTSILNERKASQGRRKMFKQIITESSFTITQVFLIRKQVSNENSLASLCLLDFLMISGTGYYIAKIWKRQPFCFTEFVAVMSWDVT